MSGQIFMHEENRTYKKTKTKKIDGKDREELEEARKKKMKGKIGEELDSGTICAFEKKNTWGAYRKYSVKKKKGTRKRRRKSETPKEKKI